MRTIRWGMIGCGEVAEIKSGPGFYKAADSTLVAVMRRNGALAADFARRHGVARWTDDAEAILRAPDIDAVYIATQTDTHCDYALRCAAAGKAVYVEKPMAMDATQCATMIDACRAAGVPLWVGYYRRALPRFLKVRELLAAGAIGTVRTVVAKQMAPLPQAADIAADRLAWRVDPARSGGGLFVEGACHGLDLFDFLFGPVVEVAGVAANLAGAYRGEDYVSAGFRFASGVTGSGTWCYCADAEEEYTEVIGTGGRLRCSVTAPAPIRIERGGRVEVIPIGDPPHVHQPMIRSIVGEMNGQGACASTGESAARTTAVIDRILAGFRQAGAG